MQRSDPSKNCVKIKGIILNYGNSDKIGVEEMFDIVVGNSTHIDFVNESKITSDRKTKEVCNRRESKKYRLVYDKRVVLDPTDWVFKGRIDTYLLAFNKYIFSERTIHLILEKYTNHLIS